MMQSKILRSKILQSGQGLLSILANLALQYEMLRDRKLTLATRKPVPYTPTLRVRGRLCTGHDTAEPVHRTLPRQPLANLRWIPLYAKSGQLLKRVAMSDVAKIDGRWYPKKMNYKDMLKSGEGTDFIVLSIKFNPDIPEHIFSKGSLKKQTTKPSYARWPPVWN